MADQKIFAGPRIRRIRNGQGPDPDGDGRGARHLALLSQPDRAQPAAADGPAHPEARLGLQGRSARSCRARRAARSPRCREVFADPLLAGELPGDQELIEIAEAAPNAAAGDDQAFRAYREQAERLSDLNELLAREGRATALSGARLPIDEVREIFERRPNHFAAHRGGGRGLHRAARPGRRSVRRAEGLAEARARHRRAGAAGRHHAQLAPPLRPPFAAPVPVRAAVALRPVARGRDGGLPDPHARWRSPPRSRR